MTENDEMSFPPAAVMEQLQAMSETATDSQMDMVRQWMEMSAGGQLPEIMQTSMGLGSAVFKTRVQSGGRISIPDAERDVLDIEEGDIVQAFIIPLKRSDD